MSVPRRRPQLLLLLLLLILLLIAAGIAIGVAVGSGSGNERSSPQVLNKPTSARRVRPLRPGPTPGFGHPRLDYEKHGKGD